MASMARPPLTSREENFMFVDTLPSLYYDMLIVNTFAKFGDLMYSGGRIEDGIKRRRIVDTGASMMEKKRFVPDEHVQAMSKERRSKRKSHMARDEPFVDFPHSSSYAQVPLANFPSPRSSYKNVIETLIQAILGVIKRKEPRCITCFQCPTKSYSRY